LSPTVWNTSHLTFVIVVVVVNCYCYCCCYYPCYNATLSIWICR